MLKWNVNVAGNRWTIKTQNLSQKKNIGFIAKKNDTICAWIVYGKNVKQRLIYSNNQDDVEISKRSIEITS